MASFRSIAAIAAVAVGVGALVLQMAPAEAANGIPSKKYAKSHSRHGGYSYNQFEVINTYGDARGRYGQANSLRDPQLGRQSESGPFDHGFFFDSGIERNGGEAPYMH